MFRFSGFTQKANNAINVAMGQAGLLGHTYIGSEHLILGMLDENSGVAHTLLTERNITFDAYRQAIIATVGQGDRTSLTPEDFTPRCKKALEMSIIRARMMGHNQVGTEHILMVLAKEPDSYGVRLLKEHGVDPATLSTGITDMSGGELPSGAAAEGGKKTIIKAPPISGTSSVRTPSLDKYSRDLTELARQGRLDPVIGRAAEVTRTIQILSRRTKNNPCLIGEAGVGKTAIVEGLAQKIVAGDVPSPLCGKRLVALDLTSMVAGAKYRGDFEDRIKTVLEEVAENHHIILFIDELHTIMGAGAAEGAIDAANILKPQLARGEIHVIGATTIAEYRRFIEKDSALERRFQSILINPPDEADAIEILRGLRDKYEEHHHIRITDDAISAAVSLSARYIPDRYLPDKAIDLMDEAAARARMKHYTAPQDVSELETRLCELQEEMDAAIVKQDFELAASIRDREKTLKSRIQERRGDAQSGYETEYRLGKNDISDLVADVTGIEMVRFNQEEDESLLHLESGLRRRVIGQERAVQAVANAVRRGKSGLGDPRRPVGSFIFLGPTGVGKTELCRALAENLFGQKDALIRLDMSEYMEKHAVSKLIGAPPGYVGYEEGGQLTGRVRSKPWSVVLFDEIEKAHSDVFHLLLQILEDGVLTDSQGRAVNFKNTVIIMTSNVGARSITDRRSLGFSAGNKDGDTEVRHDIMQEFKQTFRPEFLNRVDEVIIFDRLGDESVRKITEKLFDELAQRAGDNGISLRFSDAVLERIAREGADTQYGARPLRRAIQRMVEDELARELLKGDVVEGDEVLCDYENDGVIFRKHTPVPLLPENTGA